MPMGRIVNANGEDSKLNANGEDCKCLWGDCKCQWGGM